MPTDSRRGRIWVQAGLIVLWVSALLAVPLEGGDCGGSIDTCIAAAALGRSHIQIAALVLFGITVVALASLRVPRGWSRGALLVSSAALATAGLWVLVAQAARPDWLPIAFLFTSPAALLLFVGAVRGSTAKGALSRDVARR